MFSVVVPDLDRLKDPFDRDGFAIARGLFSPEEVTEVQEPFDASNVPGVVSLEKDGITDPDDPLYRYPRVVQPHRHNAVARHLLHPGVARMSARTFRRGSCGHAKHV